MAIIGGAIVTSLFLDVYHDAEANAKWNEALEYCERVGKPILNAGCGNNPRFVADVNLDKEDSILPNYIKHDLNMALPFGDKQFGAAVAFHVLEHVEDPKFTLGELNRVADRLYIVVPHHLGVLYWLTPEHKRMFHYGRIFSLR